MRAHEHYQAAEKALDGAKELLKQADEMNGVGLEKRRDSVLMSASLLVGVANVHANLAQAAQLSNTVGLAASREP